MKKSILKPSLIAIFILVALGLVIFFKKSSLPIVNQNEQPEEAKEEVVNTETDNQESKPVVKSSEDEIFDRKMKEATNLFLKKDYQGAINIYNDILKTQKSEYAYAGIYSASLALKDYQGAEKAILSAIEIDSKGSDYWSWYLVLLQDAIKAPRAKIDAVYNQALNKVQENKKINIITAFARILENLGDYKGAVLEWQKAITLNPDMKDVYQIEIDSLNSKI